MITVSLAVLAGMAIVMQARSLPDCLSDDAFISFRYASNWVSGDGPVFNPGESQPVEGYTNFLWTALLAGAMALGADPEVAARGLGIAFLLIVLGVCILACRFLDPERPYLWGIPAVLLAANSYVVVEAIQGLETIFFALLVTATVAAFVRESDSDAWPASGLWLGLAILTRPEGLLLGAVLSGFRALELWRHRRRPGRRDLLWTGLFLAPAAGHLLFRLTYYGDWLPNTFYAKTGGGLSQAVRGALYVGNGLGRVAPWLVLAAVAVALGLLLKPAAGQRPRTSLFQAGLAWLFLTLGVMLVGGDFKPTYRFLVWGFPLLAILATCGLGRIWGVGGDRWRRATMAVSVAALATSLIWSWTRSAPARHFARQRAVDVAQLRQVSAWLADNLSADTLLATGPSGAIPYYTGFTTIDMWGLNDRDIARRPMPAMGRGAAGHEKGDGASVLARRPDVVLFTRARLTPRPFRQENLRRLDLSVSERELLALPEFGRQYRWRSVPLSGATFNFFQRNGNEEPS